LADFLDRFLFEEIATVVFYDRPDKVSAYGVVEADEVRLGTFRRGKARTEIRSWNGSLDVSV
jgi:hypothetical protein